MVFVSPFLFVKCDKKANSQPPATDQRKFYPWTQFVMGADLSYVNQVQDYGGVYKDSGVVKDPFIIFKNHGANIVRVRLWHNPQWLAPLNNGRLYSDLADVAKTIGITLVLLKKDFIQSVMNTKDRSVSGGL